MGIREQYQHAADPHGKLYDSRAGMQALYRYALRNPYEHSTKPKVHASVQSRIRCGTDYYAPKVLDEGIRDEVVWTDDGLFSEGGVIYGDA